MRQSIIRVALLASIFAVHVSHAESPTTAPAGPLSFTVKNIEGKDVDLSAYRGQVVMIVNVASKCGLTKQYDQLGAMYKARHGEGLTILGFPANDFNGQEPGSDEEIAEFCRAKYDITFPMFSKISVKGPEKAPLYKFLTEKETAGEFAGEIGWNFTKFLIGRDGKIVARFESRVKPDAPEVTEAIDRALAAKV